MKKLSADKRLLSKRKQRRKIKKETRISSKVRHDKLRLNSKLHGLSGRLIKYHRDRAEFRKKFFRSRNYRDPEKSVTIDGSFGLEIKSDIDRFLIKSSELIDFTNRELKLELDGCTRMWPSAITLLCSLKQWVELSTWNKKIKPSISSTKSSHDEVNSYLYHCGFNDYVGLNYVDKVNGYNDSEIVKIRRETKTINVEEREDEILNVIESFTNFNKDQIRLFHAKVLIEIFLNVTEHGVSGYDNGWWVLAQYHPTSGLISISIADNGIGIKNSLITGPQREAVEKTYPVSKLNDGEVIRYATETRVSGALKASNREKLKKFSPAKYPVGSKRGNGLDRIKSGCKELGVDLTILSHYGYLLYDASGNEFKCGTMPNRVFAGTLYHLSVPAKKGPSL